MTFQADVGPVHAGTVAVFVTLTLGAAVVSNVAKQALAFVGAHTDAMWLTALLTLRLARLGAVGG